MLTVGHFFAGGGGGILASEILGHESIFALEIDKRRCRIIEESGWFPSIHVECSDIREFDPKPWKGKMDCIAAGFPCQDISCAGHGRGIRGERSGLVFELFHIIDVVRPSLVFLENSPRIRTKGRDVVVAELVARGYTWRDGTLAASHVGAGHLRNRWWLLAADADGHRQLEQERMLAEEWGWLGDESEEASDVDEKRLQKSGNDHGRKEPSGDKPFAVGPETFTSNPDTEFFADDRQPIQPESRGQDKVEPSGTGGAVTHLDKSGRERGPGEIDEETGWIEFTDRLERAVELGGLSIDDAEAIAVAAAYTGTYGWSPPDLGIRRVVDGLADRMDRIKTCGDGQAPLQAAIAWALLAWS